MARVRNLKPGFFKNEDLAECSAFARLCFAGLWTLADRDGRLEDRPKRIKGELFAFDSIEVDPLLAELARYGFICRYKAPDGRGLIQVSNFAKHQNPHHREPTSALPPPESPGLVCDAMSPKPRAHTTCDDDKAQGQPRASLGLDPPKGDLARGSSRAEPGTRNKEQGTRNKEPGEPSADPEGPPARQRASPRTKPAALGADDLQALGVDHQHAADWLAVRKAKDLPLTRTAWDQTVAEAGKAGITPAEAVRMSAANGWAGFRASWLARQDDPKPNGAHAAVVRPLNRQLAIEAENRRVAAEWLAQEAASDGAAATQPDTEARIGTA